MRKTSTVFIYIDAARAMQDGIKFSVSANGVILSTGDEQGYLLPTLFSRVEGRFGEKTKIWGGQNWVDE